MFELAGIRKKDIAFRLGVSNTLVTLWSQGKRSITWSHFETLLDYALDPATVWKLAERLKTEEAIPVGQYRPERTPGLLISKLITVMGYHQNRIYEDIEAITQQLAEVTKPAPVLWDLARLRELSHRLSEDLLDMPLLKLHIDPRLEKALTTLKYALGDTYFQEGPAVDVEFLPTIMLESSYQHPEDKPQEESNATADPNGRSTGQSHD